MGANVILVGFMGTGKSAVGRRLASALSLEFVDTDDIVEELAGKDIAGIFATAGEGAFRDLETEACRQISGRGGVVASTGGGVLGRAENVRLLKSSGKMICLTATVETILERTRPWASRPLLAGAVDPAATVRGLLQRRAGDYAQADLTVDTSGRSVDEVVEAICAELRSP